MLWEQQFKHSHDPYNLCNFLCFISEFFYRLALAMKESLYMLDNHLAGTKYPFESKIYKSFQQPHLNQHTNLCQHTNEHNRISARA